MRYLLILSLLLTVGCSGESTTSPNPDGSLQLSNGSMAARIDSTAWNARSLATALVPMDPIFAPVPILSVIGSGSPGRVIRMQISPPPTATGTFTVESGIASFSLSENEESVWQATSRVVGSTGTVTLTTLTPNRVAGSFSFTGVLVTAGAPTTRTISEGAFDVTF